MKKYIFVEEDSSNELHEQRTKPNIGEKHFFNGKRYEVVEIDEPQHGHNADAFVYLRVLQ